MEAKFKVGDKVKIKYNSEICTITGIKNRDKYYIGEFVYYEKELEKVEVMNEFKIGDAVIIKELRDSRFHVLNLDGVIVDTVGCTYHVDTKIGRFSVSALDITKKLTEPKFKIGDNVIRVDRNPHIEYTVSAIVHDKSCGTYKYVLGVFNSDEISKSDWVIEKYLILRSEHHIYLARQEKLREKLVEAEKVRAALNKLEQEISELETK